MNLDNDEWGPRRRGKGGIRAAFVSRPVAWDQTWVQGLGYLEIIRRVLVASNQ